MEQAFGRLTESAAILDFLMDTMQEAGTHEYLNSLALALWKTGGMPDMVAVTERKFTQEFREFERNERAGHVSVDARGGVLGSWDKDICLKNAIAPSSTYSSVETVDSKTKTREAKAHKCEGYQG